MVRHRHVRGEPRPPRDREAVEPLLHERDRHLARPIRPEVEEDQSVAVLDARAVADDRRLEQLIAALVPLVAAPDRRLGGRDARAIGIDDRAPRPLRAVPALVAVHRPVPAVDRRDRDLDLREQLERAARGHVAAVEEAVVRDAPDALAPGELAERVQVPQVGVDAAGREQTEEMERAAIADGPARAGERLVPEERPVVDRVVDPDELLVLDVPGPHGEVSDLAVAHDAVGEPDGAPARVETRARVAGEQRVDARRAGVRRGVAGPVGRDPPPVEDAEDDRSQRKAATIAANSSAFSDAPPTSAPSTPSAPAQSRQFAALTLPPYRIVDAFPPNPRRISSSRIFPMASEACAGVATTSVPMAQIGSYAIANR